MDAFSVNAKGRKEIMEHIELLYTATGAKGLAEKYGYVPEESDEEIEGENTDCGRNIYEDRNLVAVKEEFADALIKEEGPKLRLVLKLQIMLLYCLHLLKVSINEQVIALHLQTYLKILQTHKF